MGVIGLMGCGSKKIDQCTTNSDCMDVLYPFCDVNGEFAPSDGEKNVCTIIPPDCPVDRCGCSPGAKTCAAGELTTCNLDGKSTSSSACALGCATTSDRCLTFTPANGLGPALTAAAGEPDVVFPSQVTINTDTGEVRDAANILVPVTALTVTQTNSVSFEVLIAKSFDITNAKVTGANALAFVSVGDIKIHGLVNMSANMNIAGPGATTTGACVGMASIDFGGGAGNATVGGDGGGDSTVAGGATQLGFEPLHGGCNGGAPAFGGGGGALQLDSLGTIDFTSAAVLNLGGGGSVGTSGGGSGGNALIEAPVVTVEGNLVGNGGSAGSSIAGCTSSGSNATTDAVAAPGGGCRSSIQTFGYGGGGGTRATAPTGGSGRNGAGGGGGAIGRLHVRTQTGSYDHTSGTIGLADSSEALALH